MYLANEFGIGLSTISDIKKSADSIVKCISSFENIGDTRSRKTLRAAFDDKLDEAVFLWFLQKRSSGQPISGPILCEKALHFNGLMGGNDRFKA